MNKKNLIIGGGVVAALLITFFVVKGSKSSDSIEILTSVKKGTFKVEIETTGELEAKNSVNVSGPSGLREFRIGQITIQDIIPEGTQVKKGDWIATLDKSEFKGKLLDKEIELDQDESEFQTVQLDTALQMSGLRDELGNLAYAVTEKEIVVEQSAFEPEATKRQVQIDLEKAQRALAQAKSNYKIKYKQNLEKIQQANTRLRKSKQEYSQLVDLDNQFLVVAPQDGMVIYKKGFDNKPIKAGSQISAWDATVATLPDLTTMISKTYVNEVDVRKVKRGQKVEIGLDAFPDKRLAGIVTYVANVGEQRPNSDAKVFQVDIQIGGSDPSLKPAMTTSNKIVATVIDSALFAQLETLHSLHDSITYVFKKDGIKTVKQEVMIGETNANEAVILAGLQEGDRLYLSIPPGFDDDSPINLLEEMNGKRKKKEEPPPLPEIAFPADGGRFGGVQGGQGGQGGQRGNFQGGQGGQGGFQRNNGGQGANGQGNGQRNSGSGQNGNYGQQRTPTPNGSQN